MLKKIVKLLFVLNLSQIVIYLFGFFNKVADQTGNLPLVDVSSIWMNFPGIVYWSILSMICVMGVTLSIYLLTSKEVKSTQYAGLIISVIGYASPIIFSFFLIIPATLLILGTLFIKLLIIDDTNE